MRLAKAGALVAALMLACGTMAYADNPKIGSKCPYLKSHPEALTSQPAKGGCNKCPAGGDKTAPACGKDAKAATDGKTCNKCKNGGACASQAAKDGGCKDNTAKGACCSQPSA